MARKSRSRPRVAADLCILRLAAMGLDVRRSLRPRDIDRAPSLAQALVALEAVLREMGWDDAVAERRARPSVRATTRVAPRRRPAAARR